MPKQLTGAALTAAEKRLVKAMLLAKERSQDIHILINRERNPSVNVGRISPIRNDKTIVPATAEEVAAFKRMKMSFDPVTGLNAYNDERLIRSREAMILAVTIFNSGSYKFKTEVFSVLANIAWCYLMHDYYSRRSVSITNSDGTTFALSHMLSRQDCPLSKGIKQNLDAIKLIRDEVEHRLFGRSDQNWLPIFQACCLNYDKIIVEWYGQRVSLQNDLSVALQFGKLSMEQAAQIQTYDIPPNIAALDAQLASGKTDEELNDIEYQFKVIYTLDSASKGSAHIQFVHPDSEEGKTIHNVLQKFKIADELYPFKPGDVVQQVRKAGKVFSMADHTRAWQKYKVRPANNAKAPDKTDRGFCIYHPSHKDYTYNQKWVDKLASEAKPPAQKPPFPSLSDLDPQLPLASLLQEVLSQKS